MLPGWRPGAVAAPRPLASRPAPGASHLAPVEVGNPSGKGPHNDRPEAGSFQERRELPRAREPGDGGGKVGVGAPVTAHPAADAGEDPVEVDAVERTQGASRWGELQDHQSPPRAQDPSEIA